MSEPGLALLREALLSSNLVTETQWDNALKVAHIRKMSLEHVFVEMGIFEASQISEISEILYGIPKMALDFDAITPDVLEVLPKEQAEKYRALPLSTKGESRVTIGLVDPMDVDVVDSLRYTLQRDIRVVWISEEDFKRGLRLYAGTARGTVARILEDIKISSEVDLTPADEGAPVETEELLRLMAEEAPVVRLANLLLSQAVQSRASDIHVEPGRKEARIRMRVDGALHVMMRLPMTIYPALSSRLKLMANLDIAERRLPQDGRYSCTLEGRSIDMRLAAVPSLHGEKLVIRIIDTGKSMPKLSELGYSDGDLLRIERMLAQPHGMILVTGPTGSGKSTTMYSALEVLNTPDRNIQTIEDPIERKMDGICQVQAHAHIGLSFARVLRSFLRQDPDVIMVGEIRDEETALIAVQAAMTGHLLLSSLHTNDAIGTVTRLMDMGVPSYKVASALRGVLAQRLVRRLCPDCSVREPVDPEEVQLLGYLPDGLDVVHHPRGCPACSQTGYKGRIVVAEVLTITPDMSRAIAMGAPERLPELASASGMDTMSEDALRKVRMGLITIADMVRATMTLES